MTAEGDLVERPDITDFSAGELKVLTELGPGSIVPIELTVALATFALRLRSRLLAAEQDVKNSEELRAQTAEWMVGYENEAADLRKRLLVAEDVVKAAKIGRVIEDEEAFVKTLRSDPFKYLMAAAIHRATGIQGGVTSPDGLPHLIAEGVIAYLAASVEQSTQVRRDALATYRQQTGDKP
jgi:hypothetical protein